MRGDSNSGLVLRMIGLKTLSIVMTLSHILMFMVLTGCCRGIMGQSMEIASDVEPSSTTPTIEEPLFLNRGGTTVQLCIYEFYTTISAKHHSCVDRCNLCGAGGMYGVEFCRCDARCVLFGDCCFDYEYVCSGGKSCSEESGDNKDIIGIPGSDILYDDDPDTYSNDNVPKSLSFESPEDFPHVGFLNRSVGITPSGIPDVGEVVNQRELEIYRYNTTPLYTCTYWNKVLTRTVYNQSKNLHCIRVSNDSGAYILSDTCVTSSSTSHLCLASSRNDDPLTTIPVLGTDGVHYKNVFCALCNGLDYSNLKFWDLTFIHCANLTEDGSAYLANIEETCTLQITYDTKFQMDRPRVCAVDMRTDCPDGDESLIAACSSYSAPIRINVTLYKNPHCAQCHGVNTSDIDGLCEELDDEAAGGNTDHTIIGPGPPIIPENDNNKGTSLSILFDINGNTQVRYRNPNTDGGKIVIIDSLTCPTGATFDPFLGRCRQLSCPSNFEFIRDTCKPLWNFTGEIRSGFWHLNVSLSLSDDSITDDELMNPFLKMIDNIVIFHDYYITNTISSADDAILSNKSCPGIAGVQRNLILTGEDVTNNSFTNFVDTISSLIQNAISDRGTIGVDGKIIFLTRFTISNHFNKTACDDSNHKMVVLQNVSETVNFDGAILFQDIDGTTTKTYDTHEVFRKITFSRHFGCQVLWKQSKESFVCPLKLSCKLITLESSEFRWLDVDQTIFIHIKSAMNVTSDSFIDNADGGVQICEVELKSFVAILYGKFYVQNEGQELATSIGISISILSLCFVIITYIIFSDLRNVPGKTVMSLSIALILAQLLLLVGIDKTKNESMCMVISLVMHYSWLAAFLWTNVLSFDLARTFGSKSSIRRHDSTSVFLRYSLYAWGIPLIIVTITTIVHFTLVVEGGIGNIYDLVSSCWLRSGQPILMAFSIPVFCLLLVNLGLFSYTIIGIQRTRLLAKILQDSNQKKSSGVTATDLNLTIRLSITVGLPWIFGFIIPFTNVPQLWYIFIILNSLQGPIIFTSFAWNQRVLKLWRKKLGLWSTAASGSNTNESESNVSNRHSVDMKTMELRMTVHSSERNSAVVLNE